jgi:hypothetical protein
MLLPLYSLAKGLEFFSQNPLMLDLAISIHPNRQA